MAAGGKRGVRLRCRLPHAGTGAKQEEAEKKKQKEKKKKKKEEEEEEKREKHETALATGAYRSMSRMWALRYRQVTPRSFILHHHHHLLLLLLLLLLLFRRCRRRRHSPLGAISCRCGGLGAPVC